MRLAIGRAARCLLRFGMAERHRTIPIAGKSVGGPAAAILASAARLVLPPVVAPARTLVALVTKRGAPALIGAIGRAA